MPVSALIKERTKLKIKEFEYSETNMVHRSAQCNGMSPGRFACPYYICIYIHLHMTFSEHTLQTA